MYCKYSLLSVYLWAVLWTLEEKIINEAKFYFTKFTPFKVLTSDPRPPPLESVPGARTLSQRDLQEQAATRLQALRLRRLGDVQLAVTAGTWRCAAHYHLCGAFSRSPLPLSPPAADPWPFGQPAALRAHLRLHLAVPLQQPVVWCPAAALPQGGHARQPRQHGGGQPPPGRLPLGRLQHLGRRALPPRDGGSVGERPQGGPGWLRPWRTTMLCSRRPPSQRGGWQSHAHQHLEAPACLGCRPARRRHCRCWLPVGRGVTLGGPRRSLPVSVTLTKAVKSLRSHRIK